jgi:hypothetical protein
VQLDLGLNLGILNGSPVPATALLTENSIALLTESNVYLTREG